MSPGHYYHFGLGNCLKNALGVEEVKLLVGIDGIPTAKSNQLKEVGLEVQFVIGLYSSPSKPDCVNELFFLEEKENKS